MPLLKTIDLKPGTRLFLWKITERYDELLQDMELTTNSLIRLAGMKSIAHQKGFLGVRKLLQEVGYQDSDLYYDDNGKPHLKDGTSISISHSHEFSALVLSDDLIGLDLELLKDKTLRIASRFMDVSHLDGLTSIEQIKKATVVWGIKEAIFKIKNEKGISFPLHIFEAPFQLNDKQCSAELRFNNQVEPFTIHFEFVEDYVLVCAMKLQL
jgi:4'-phosphopantetheinyl transferase